MQNHFNLNFRVIREGHAYMGVGGMYSLTLRTLETKNNLQDIMRRSRDSPNSDVKHEFDAMTSPK